MNATKLQKLTKKLNKNMNYIEYEQSKSLSMTKNTGFSWHANFEKEYHRFKSNENFCFNF